MASLSTTVLDPREPVLIGITGGPCSGKSTILSFLNEELSNLGFSPYFAFEGATLLMQQGMKLKRAVRESRWSDVRRYQLEIMHFQWENEERLRRIAALEGGRAVILCDRCLPDSLAYLPGEEGMHMYVELLREIGLTPITAMERYKAVIKLTTAADGAAQFYTLENNPDRDETPEQAIMLDRAIERVYVDHPHLRVVDNATAFEVKKQRALKEICHALGVPVPLEIEKKYLLTKFPDFDDLIVVSRPVRIVQAYLREQEDGETRRIRRRTRDSSSTHYLTRKRAIDTGIRSEIEMMISWSDYFDLLEERDLRRGIIQKDRISFLWHGQYFELDRFLNTPASLILLEIELTDIQQEIVLPPWLGAVADVTDDPHYQNTAIALTIAA